MHEVKDTLRARVRIGYDGRVHKVFRGPRAADRFANEVRVLRHLEKTGCPFVPRLIEADPDALRMVTSNCGSRVEHIAPERTAGLFAELETYGVRHEDPEARNITYRQSDGRFCVIDFEFATILDENHAKTEPDSGSPRVDGDVGPREGASQ
jgi:PPM family protein phosphatase